MILLFVKTVYWLDSINKAMLSRFVDKYSLDSLKIAVSVQRIRLKIAGLRPLIPAVYCNQRSGQIMGIDIFFCLS